MVGEGVQLVSFHEASQFVERKKSARDLPIEALVQLAYVSVALYHDQVSTLEWRRQSAIDSIVISTHIELEEKLLFASYFFSII